MKVQLSAAEEQCETLQDDLESTELSKDTLIQKAWDARDAAVKRKHSSEVELAKERVASMQVNSQLMEAIQQKVELSQQLGMVSHKKSLITIFGQKLKIKNFIKKFDIFL